MNIRFLGASGMVTGSCYLLSGGAESLLIDLGTFQGRDDVAALNSKPLDLDGNSLSAMLLTHAHLDHCGRLPLILKTGFKGPIYMNQATRDLCEITLLDSARVANEHDNAYHHAMYDEEDVAKVLSQVKIISYETPFNVGSFNITYRDAGHILGSASIEIVKDNKKIVFSGDLGNSPEDLLRPTELIDTADFVVMESTYGDRIHSNEVPLDVIQEEINEVEASGGALLIPAFAVERSQEILHLIDHLKKSNKIKADTAVFLDSPMAIRTTEVYEHYRNLYSQELSDHAKQDDPFDFPGLFITENHKKSEQIKEHKGAKVIIAGSGMMNGGRILQHCIDFLSSPTTRLLIVGFQADGTIGRQIIEGSKKLRIYNEPIEINAHIRKSSGMSAHADQPKLLNWIKHIKGVQKLFLTHGEDVSRAALARKIKDDLGLSDINLPKLGEDFII